MNTKRISMVFMFFLCILPLYAQTPPRSPITVNLIIDGSAALANVRSEINSWLFNRLDQILLDGDSITVWSAGTAANVIFSGTVRGDADRQTLQTRIREFSPSGDNPNFSAALRDAAGRPAAGISYTLLISASPASLTNLLTGPQAGHLRFSRIEEFNNWRSVVVGLNMDAQVQRAVAAFFEQ